MALHVFETELPDVPKPETVRKLCSVDAAELAARVGLLSEAAWASEDAGKENDFAVFHSTRHMIFRFIDGNMDPRSSYDRPAWMIWRPMIQPILDTVAAAYGFANPAYPKVMLARLLAGQVIDRHRDGAGSNPKVHKVHVPLVTNPGAVFSVWDEPFHLAPGHAYEVNNIAPHGARNDGDEDRIHLIFEVFGQAA